MLLRPGHVICYHGNAWQKAPSGVISLHHIPHNVPGFFYIYTSWSSLWDVYRYQPISHSVLRLYLSDVYMAISHSFFVQKDGIHHLSKKRYSPKGSQIWTSAVLYCTQMNTVCISYRHSFENENITYHFSNNLRYYTAVFHKIIIWSNLNSSQGEQNVREKVGGGRGGGEGVIDLICVYNLITFQAALMLHECSTYQFLAKLLQ